MCVYIYIYIYIYIYVCVCVSWRVYRVFQRIVIFREILLFQKN